ncbi:MAG: hypothetical protein JWR70_712 [Modestobacter sp.]|jgi:hypothetical protein|nr:hypothetical protein [Modestobacter sp.]
MTHSRVESLIPGRDDPAPGIVTAGRLGKCAGGAEKSQSRRS